MTSLHTGSVILLLFLMHPSNAQPMDSHLESLAPNLIVNDVNKAVDFYTQRLGFILVMSKPEKGPYEWAMVTKDGVTIMFQTFNSLKDAIQGLEMPSGSFGTLFIRVTGIEAYYRGLKDKVRVVSELTLTPYAMHEFTIQDPNGYYLTFAERK